MRRFLVSILLAAFAVALGAPAASARLAKCHLAYDLEGWSVFYKRATGTGRITCDNGQSGNVRISAHGGGISFGTMEVVGGKGTFSGVRDIAELYGTYVEAAAHAGVGGSTDARAMTKGNVSLSLAGTGQGLNIGFGFGGFTIEPR